MTTHITKTWFDGDKVVTQEIAESEIYKQEPVAWMTINAYGEEDDIHYENPEGHLLEGWTYEPLYTHPPQTQQPPVNLRRGNILRCIETDELCTVWATSTTGKTLVKWSANNFGDYTAEQIGELFWMEPAPVQEPVAWMSPSWIDPNTRGWQSDSFESIPIEGWLPIYTTPPQRKPLTDEEISNLWSWSMTREAELTATTQQHAFARAIEAKLRSKNENR